MLRKLTSSLPTFKTLEFREGLNVLVADRTQVSAETDTRNGAGKSSVVELLHFLLGGRADKKSLAMKPQLQEYWFILDLDWPMPHTHEGRNLLSVSRRGTARERQGRVRDRVTLDPFLPFAADSLIASEGTISNSEWQAAIEDVLFGLPDEHPCVSGRSMLSYYMRRASANAFNTATRHTPMQSVSDIAGNLSYLFSLNWRAAADYKDIAEKEELRRKLRQAAKDPMLGRIVGNSAELRSQVAVAQQRAATLERQLAEFHVVPEYERLKAEADRLSAQIRSETDADVIDQRNLTQLEEAVAEEQPPGTEYVERAYAQLGIDLPSGVRRSYTAVKEFHDSLVRNRRYYLESEIRTIRERMEGRRSRIQSLDARRAEVMQALKRGGALESFLSLQGVLAREQANVQVLRSRFEAAEALEATDLQIRARRVELQERMMADLAERSRAVTSATVTYADYARTLYGEDREAYLVISATESGVRFNPHIESDDSLGISSMVIFCFDLTMAVMARRAGIGPDFLVHDSHLFDGVDSRQVARALQLGARVAKEEGIQYIVTMNSDDLQKTTDHGFDPTPYLLPVRLTDAREDGGLFGFRFP